MLRRRGAAPSWHPMLTRPVEHHGIRAVGRIVKLFMGQCYGFVRLSDAREIYFHRGDLGEGTAFCELNVGDSVVFELFDDRISGARALQLRRQARSG